MLLRLPRLGSKIALLAASLALVIACGRSADPPPTNPLQPTAEATLAPSGTPSGSPATGAPGGGPNAEAAAAQAAALMAEWLGVPGTSLDVLAVEAVDWTDSCLGVAFPSESCDEAIAPGWEVLLLDPLDGAHTLRLGPGGAARWTGETAAAGIVTSIDLPSRSMRLELPNGDVELRFAPGTRFEDGVALETLEAGQQVFFGADTAPDGDDALVAAWLFTGE